MAGRWRLLSFKLQALPQLLVKATLDVTGYTIHLTDLSRIWGETLNKKQLFRRALDDGCSIDPTEGDDQLRILIDKIGNALEQRDDTSLVIQPTKEDDLVLKLTAPLPSPLPELKWDVYLTQLPARNVQVELITPLLHHAQNLQTLMQNLVHEIQDKDRVISKITDRLEQYGQDLTDVFPGVSNIKLARKRSNQTQREQLAKHVKGLGDFDEREWRSRHESMNGHGAIRSEALNSLLGDIPPTSEASPDSADQWWQQLDDETTTTARSQTLTRESHDQEQPANTDGLGSARNTTVEIEETHVDHYSTMVDADDLGFQRQGTPPNLKYGKREKSQRVQSSFPGERPPVAADDESTEDEDDDLDAPPVTSAKSAAFSPSVRQRSASPDKTETSTRKLGMVGGRKNKPDSPKGNSGPGTKDTSCAPSPPKPRSKLGRIGGKTEVSSTPEPEAAAPAPAPLSKSKLGRIGGKKQTPPVEQQAPPSSATEGSASPPPARKQGRLGKIGGKKADGGSPAKVNETVADADEAGGRKSRESQRNIKEPSPPRETSEERANRRREELKRHLEEQAKAPVKKKRKF